jgi:hypothetical protein
MLIYSLFIRVLFSDSTFLARKYKFKFESLYSGFKGQPFTGAISHALTLLGTDAFQQPLYVLNLEGDISTGYFL